MDPISRGDVNALLDLASPWYVSIYLPTTRVGSQVLQNRIRLKNLLARAEEELVGQGMRAPEARELLAPATALVDDSSFGSDHPLWRDPSDGLALFCAENECRYWRLPLAFRERLWVGRQFYLKPLWQVLPVNGNYYLLAVSQNEAALYQGTRYELQPLPAEHVPPNMRAAMRYDQPGGMFNDHRGDTGVPDTEGTVYHGQGGPNHLRKDDLRHYFRAIDRELPKIMQDRPGPLVFAGVDYLFPIYQEANTYPHLTSVAIEGNPERLPISELHSRALPIVEPIWNVDEQRDAARYEELAGTPLGSDDIAEIVRSAFDGRIDALFVATDQEIWGRFDPATYHLEYASEPAANTVDLVDLAATEAYRRDARIHAAPADQLPVPQPLAALFRHPSPPIPIG